jgi:hypothetical protein
MTESVNVNSFSLGRGGQAGSCVDGLVDGSQPVSQCVCQLYLTLPPGRILDSILVVYGQYARLENISEDGRWACASIRPMDVLFALR